MTRISNLLKPLVISTTVTFSVVFSLSAQAITIGSPITGSMTFANINVYEPNDPYFPAPKGLGFLNASDESNSTTVNLSNQKVEFGMSIDVMTETADFTTTGLTISQIFKDNIPSLTRVFVSDAFKGLTINKISDSFNGGGVTYSLSNDTLTVTTFGNSIFPGMVLPANYSASFEFIAPAATSVPEPFTVIGTLVGGTAAFRMKKKLKLARK
jgi:hypothetical protein